MHPYKESAVMILLVPDEAGRLSILFEKRALTMKTQPGDICLPGGRKEKDESSKDTAMRECGEELGIPIEDIDYIGEMDYLINPYGIRIDTHIGVYTKNEFNINSDEVDHVFFVPVEFFIDNLPEVYDIGYGALNLDGFPFDKIEGGTNYKFRKTVNNKYFYYYKDYVIWGFTADIIKHFIESFSTY